MPSLSSKQLIAFAEKFTHLTIEELKQELNAPIQINQKPKISTKDRNMALDIAMQIVSFKNDFKSYILNIYKDKKKLVAINEELAMIDINFPNLEIREIEYDSARANARKNKAKYKAEKQQLESSIAKLDDFRHLVLYTLSDVKEKPVIVSGSEAKITDYQKKLIQYETLNQIDQSIRMVDTIKEKYFNLPLGVLEARLIEATSKLTSENKEKVQTLILAIEVVKFAEEYKQQVLELKKQEEAFSEEMDRLVLDIQTSTPDIDCVFINGEVNMSASYKRGIQLQILDEVSRDL